MKPVKAWAIKTLDGEIELDSIRKNKSECTGAFTNYNGDWKSFWNEVEGFRCVRVVVTEVNPASAKHRRNCGEG